MKIEKCHIQVLISRVTLRFIMSEKLWPHIFHVLITLHRMVVETLVRVAHLDTEEPVQVSPHMQCFFHIVLNPRLAHWENKRLSMTCFLSKMRESTLWEIFLFAWSAKCHCIKIIQLKILMQNKPCPLNLYVCPNPWSSSEEQNKMSSFLPLL